GKSFTRHRNGDGRPQLNFAEPVDRSRNTRDPMVLHAGGRWICYYTAHPANRGADYARTSVDLLNWEPERVVAARGRSGDGPYSAECPFVVEPQPGHFFLFRTQHYGKDAQTMVYHSRSPRFWSRQRRRSLRDHVARSRAGDFSTRRPVVHRGAAAEPQGHSDYPIGMDACQVGKAW